MLHFDFKDSADDIKSTILCARGLEPADMVLKNASYVNVFTNEISIGDIVLKGSRIAAIGSEYHGKIEIDLSGSLVSPGLIDAHMHLESTMVLPAATAAIASAHGTTTIISDPHEIANVLGTDGIEYMLHASEGLQVDCFFMLPSCVPATAQEESGACLCADDLLKFYDHSRVIGLAEMMNYVGVCACDNDIMKKLSGAKTHNACIDGHAPGLSGRELCSYVAAGIITDHECSSMNEALEKIRFGQYVLIREGTAAKNLSALIPLLSGYEASRCALCSDDLHLEEMIRFGHIDRMVRMAVQSGADLVASLKAATINAAQCYKLPWRGAIAPGYVADLAIFDSADSLNVIKTIKNGQIVYNSESVPPVRSVSVPEQLSQKVSNTFDILKISCESLSSTLPLGLLEMIDGQIITKYLGTTDKICVENDILKVVVAERHHRTGHIGMGYLKGYGLKKGAVATSVAHDSHNIIAVGTNDTDIALAINHVVENHGGIAVIESGAVIADVPLRIAGLMSNESADIVVEQMQRAIKATRSLGVPAERDPFIPLSFMSLTVIPEARITTKGVFHVDWQKYI